MYLSFQVTFAFPFIAYACKAARDSMNAVPLEALQRVVGKPNLLVSAEERFTYAFDASKLEAVPDAVVFPASAEEVSEILALAVRYGFPVVPRGAGSGMVGGVLAQKGGVVLVLTRLNRILELDPENMLAVVEPGVVTGRLQAEAARHGLFYPPDPASLQFSTLGGNVATGAGGPRAVKYGVTRDYVLGLEVVLPTGAAIRTGARTIKSVVGYDLTRLFVGSEGTLGVVTQITLRLIPAPETVRTLLAVFPDLDDAARTVSAVMRSRIIPSTLEFMDRATIEAVENHLKLGLPTEAEAILLIEVDGRHTVVDEDAARVEAICREHGATQVERAGTDTERDRLWKARRSISPALGRIRSGKINEDVTVPRTRIPELIRTIRDLAARYDLVIVNFGHAGDGNIHTNIMVDRKDADELRRAERAVEELFRAVIDLGGTLSGEHGIGITKSPFLQWEVDEGAFEAMWRIKRALDPANILNPGKMFVPNRAFFAKGS